MYTPTPKRNPIDRLFVFIESLPIGDRFLFKTILTAFVISLLWLGLAASSHALESIPDRGGVLREGIVGTPRFINPILAVTAADQDLAALVYSGIMTLDAEGTLVPDIARSVEISEDGRVYTIVLHDDITFHDGDPLTTDDIIFTVSRIQDPAVKSPLRASWEGVSTERLSDTEMKFILPDAYAPFTENLALGILPEHIWRNATPEELPFSQYNSEPIGAGPYKVTDITRNRSGIPESYTLRPHTAYHGTAPKIALVNLLFFQNEGALADAFVRGEIMSAGGLSADALNRIITSEQPADVYTAPLPRTFAVFFNQNETPIFRDSAVREALSLVVDRSEIIDEVLAGYGESITTPIPPGFGLDAAGAEATSSRAQFDEAREILRADGWRINEESGVWEKTVDEAVQTLTFSISTSNAPVFVQTANILKRQWEELGIPVTIRQFEQADLTQSIIRPRQYEALLFGTVVGRELDFFSFWHSSQRNDPGLNVALYTNITTDSLLAKARRTSDVEVRESLQLEFAQELERETPAIFLYVPLYTYVMSPAVKNVTLHGIALGSERFRRISAWYMQEDSVWPFFMN